MKKDIEGYIRWLNKIRAGKRRALALVLAMSLTVSGNVFWFMRNIGTALTDDPICGMEEHTHTDECYDGDTLICGKEEHVHTDACYVDTSNHETASVWEATIPSLSGDLRSDLVSVALSQVGYEQGTDSYTRYGDWYGNPNGEWNVMFVSFCLNYAGISSSDIPYGSGCWAWQVKLEEKELISDMTVMPQMGDIILVENDGDGKCDTAGIAVDITGSSISVVEGNVGGKTCVVTYQDSEVFGFVSIDPSEPEVSEEPAAAEVEEQEVQNDDALVEVFASLEAVTDSGITVNANIPEGAFPEGVTMTATDVSDSGMISRALDIAESESGNDNEVKGSVAVDITFYDSEGNEIEPAEGAQIDVTMAFPESRQLTGDDYQLFHINEEGVEKISDATVSGAEANFTSGEFSIFVVTATGLKDKDRINAYLDAAGMDPALNHDGYIQNGQYHPYYLRVGETVDLIGTVDDTSITPDLDYYYDWMSNTVVIENEVRTPGRVTATVRAIAPGSVAVKMTYGSQQENFSIGVLENKDTARIIDFNDYPEYDGTDATIQTVNVDFLDEVIVIGPSANGEFPKILDADNPDGWVIVNDTSTIGWYSDGDGRLGRRFIVDGYGGNNQQVFTLYLASGATKKIKVKANESMIDHADIEIADGGVYTEVSFDIGSGGGLTKTITQYQSYVHGVNTCKLYDSNGQLVPLYERTGDTAVLVNPLTSHFVHSDYWHDSRFSPGMSQYELTSKYRKTSDDSPYYIWSAKRFYYQDVDHVEFDVELQIIPTSVVTYSWNGTGWSATPISTEEYTIDYQNGTYSKKVDGVQTVTNGNLEDDHVVQHEDSVVFELGRRYVIDAYNKCPNHTGLDFTVHANHASVRFGATKELTNGVLHGNDFEFQLLDSNGVVKQVRNSADGKVQFGNIEFDTPGTYLFTVKEVVGTSQNIRYDTKEYQGEVTGTDVENSGGILMADVRDLNNDYTFNFVN